MADQTSQTQTTATAPSPGSPARKGTSTAAPAASPAPAESKDRLTAALAVAFAPDATQTQTETKRATRGPNAKSTPHAQAESEGNEPEDEPADDEEQSSETVDEESADETTEEGDDESPVETEESEADDESTEEEEETEPEEEATDDDESDELPPKGMEKLPKGVWKRLQKQSAKIRDLKSQLQTASAITITPTAANPLADVESLEVLSTRIDTAKAVRTWCRENPQGGQVTLTDGTTKEIDAQGVATRLQRAENELDAAADRKVAITNRAASQPWKLAEEIAPGLFTKDTPANKFMLSVLRECPELKTRVEDWEVILAAAAKGFHIATEERTGKARYVRMELDKQGNPIPPKQKPTVKQAPPPTAAQKPKPKPPTTPQSTKPALRTGNQAPRTEKEVLSTMSGAPPKDRFRALLSAAFAGSDT